MSTRQPHPWQGKEWGGSHSCQWPPVMWSNPHQKPGVLLPQPLTPLRRDTGRQTSAVPTAGDPAGRGQTALCRAAPSLRHSRDKGNRALPCKDRHSLSPRHLQGELCEHSHPKHQTHSQGQEAEKPERCPSYARLFPIFLYVGLNAAASGLAETQGHHSEARMGPASPVKKQDTPVPALFTITQLFCANSNHTGQANKPYGLETHNQSI